jgi:hypothetical protein
MPKRALSTIIEASASKHFRNERHLLIHNTGLLELHRQSTLTEEDVSGPIRSKMSNNYPLQIGAKPLSLSSRAREGGEAAEQRDALPHYR